MSVLEIPLRKEDFLSGRRYGNDEGKQKFTAKLIRGGEQLNNPRHRKGEIISRFSEPAGVV